jgi:hypothetical protein
MVLLHQDGTALRSSSNVTLQKLKRASERGEREGKGEGEGEEESEGESSSSARLGLCAPVTETGYLGLDHLFLHGRECTVC